MIPPPPRSTLFPYTTLFRSHLCEGAAAGVRARLRGQPADRARLRAPRQAPRVPLHVRGIRQDRKSTRLNSSHRCISYAVFCLKKKKKKNEHYKQLSNNNTEH